MYIVGSVCVKEHLAMLDILFKCVCEKVGYTIFFVCVVNEDYKEINCNHIRVTCS